MNGQAVHNLEQLAAACHGVGAKLLVDSYHAVGVFPVDVAVMCADFVIGGSYKYLRGGPGACFLYLSPEILASGLRPLDTGWFARENTFGYERHDPPLLRAGGDAFLESTPPVLTYYQARSGQQFTLAITVERLREYRQKQLSQLKLYLADAGINAIGGDDDHGAFDPATLLCKQGDELSCLTAPQVASLKKIYAGETDDEGHMIFPGLMPGDEAHLWKSWLVGAGPNVSLYTQGYFRYMVFDDPSWNALTAKTNAAVHAADAKTAQTLNATDPDLSLFAARGGKLILYHGWNDPAISPLNTVHYYEEVKAKMGDAKTADFLRLYMVPGMGHCAGGSGAAAFGQFGLTTAKGPEYGIFDALEKWEELDTAPGSIIATKYGAARKVEMTRPICPYPQIAKYNGNGDPNDSASFTCAAPGH